MLVQPPAPNSTNYYISVNDLLRNYDSLNFEFNKAKDDIFYAKAEADRANQRIDNMG